MNYKCEGCGHNSEEAGSCPTCSVDLKCETCGISGAHNHEGSLADGDARDASSDE